MRGLTTELKNKAIDKWSEILKNIQDKVSISYRHTYWYRCSFCDAALGCYHCSLNTIYDEYKICYNDNIEVCHAGRTLLYADGEKWEDAEKYAKIVLEAIKNTPIDGEKDVNDDVKQVEN